MFKKIFAITTITVALCLPMAIAKAEESPSVSQQSGNMATDTGATPVASIDQNAWSLVQNALGWLGAPYRRGGKSADRGFDCSGFVAAVYEKTFGLALPSSALSISKIGQPVSFAELKIGDLIFFNTLRRPFSHVGIYMGEGRFIHACSTGKQIKVDNLDQYYTKRINGFRRINLG
ncbi:MAG: C40 family peptidase [Desulfobulbaceae bacterium]|nr:C40 family peptidase [Desulfobulbaceae bacterium]